MKVWIRGEGSVRLGQRDFVGQGGQAAIYAKGAVAFKIYDDSAKMVPAGKIQELAGIADPRIIKPEKIVCDQKSNPIGYTMRYVKGSHALCQLFPRAFRERYGITTEQITDLIRQLRSGVAKVHAAGALVVDLNEMNFLVSKRFDEMYFIDVDSYQTRCYPADALMESVRDRHAPKNQFSEATDWFSFGVVSFQMFVGIHPYKGKHPAVKGIDARMTANLSVLNRDVRMPKSVYPLEVIPEAYRSWYEAVFERGERCAPPTDSGAAVVVLPVICRVTHSDALEITEVASFDRPVTGMWTRGGHLVVATDHDVWIGGRRAGQGLSNPGGGLGGVGFSPRMNKPVAALATSTIPRLLEIADKTEVAFGMNAETITSYDGRIYFKTGDKILELVLSEVGDQVVASSRVAAQVLEHATRLFDGVALQDLLGSIYVSLFPAAGVTHQLHLPELDLYRVVEAKFDAGVLMVIGQERGRYDRLVFRFDIDYRGYDVRIVEDIVTTGLNFATLDNGVCVCLDEEEQLEVFKVRKGATAMKIIEDPILGGDMHLASRDGKLIFYRGGRVYAMRMK